MPLERNNRVYGDNAVFSPDAVNDKKPKVEERARRLAWSNGCPLGENLIKPESEGGRGAEVMERSYATVNFWGGWIQDILQEEGRGEWVKELQGQTPRLASEPLGKHCPESVPQELETHMIGAGNPYSYALSRLLVTYLEEDRLTNTPLERVLNADEDIRRAAGQAESIPDFIAYFAGMLAWRMPSGLESHAKLIKQMLSVGKLAEDNCRSAYRKMANALMRRSLLLGQTYRGLRSEHLSDLGIASYASFEG